MLAWLRHTLGEQVLGRIFAVAAAGGAGGGFDARCVHVDRLSDEAALGRALAGDLH